MNASAAALRPAGRRAECVGGAARPRHGPLGTNAVFGTLVFLAAETMLFAGLASAALVLRARMPAWPPADQPRLPLGLTTANLLLLLASGHLVGRGVAAARDGRPASALRWLLATAGTGAIFLALQGVEWIRLAEHGLRLGPAVHGGIFATLIGMHGLHVLGGLAVLVGVALAVERGWIEERVPASVTAAGLYWRFVVLVWPVLWVLLYLV
jgi:heme/copper-type cytochrome/quinol oxidase subunit 3